MLSPGQVGDWLAWAVARLDGLLREISDPTNFLDDEGYIDGVFAFEHSLSVLRVLRRALHALASEEPAAGKFYAFEVADLMDRLSVAFKKRQDGQFFKLLFNPTLAPEFLLKALGRLPESLRAYFIDLTTALYEDLQDTLRRSIWLDSKLEGGQVKVRSKSLESEQTEDLGEFTSNVLRALRNTHHGYFTKHDETKRPSRYLALTTGNLPDSLASLPLVWVMALLADPEEVTGWIPLPTTAYE